MRNGFNSLIVILTVIDCVLCILIIGEYSFVRGFEVHSKVYTILYPYVVFPLSNIALSASIYMTVVLGLER